MTIRVEDPITTLSYTGAGSYAYSFKLYETDEIEVTHINASTGQRTTKTLTTHYTVTRNSDYQGGTVTTNFAGTGYLELKLAVPYEQDQTWTAAGALVLSTFERMADKIVQRIQQLAYQVDNSWAKPSYRGAWATGIAYEVGDLVISSGTQIYHCKVDHTSGTFATDLSGGKWELIMSNSDIASYLGLPSIASGDAYKVIRADPTATQYQFHHVVPSPITTGGAGKKPIVDLAGAEYELFEDPMCPMPRAGFSWNGNTSVKLYGYGVYWVTGIGPVYIDSASGLAYTFQNISGTNYWHYLYIDTSEITQRQLNATTFFRDATTAPALQMTTYKGWYSGADRCIMAFYVDGSGNITKFWHSGRGLIYHDDSVTLRAWAAMASGWNEINCSAAAPPCSDELIINSDHYDATSDSVLYMRPKGSSATNGLMMATTLSSGATRAQMTGLYPLGTDNKIEMKSTGGTTTSLAVKGLGWKLHPLM